MSKGFLFKNDDKTQELKSDIKLKNKPFRKENMELKKRNKFLEIENEILKKFNKFLEL